MSTLKYTSYWPSRADALSSIRARKSRSIAQLELLSAISVEVCEMWSGSEIVRVAGQPATNQYVSITSESSERIMTVSEALRQGIYDRNGGQADVEVVNSRTPNITLKRAGRPLIISGAL